jgi:hypothetical protein
MPETKLKGVIVFWVNLCPDMGQNTRTTLEMVKEMNQGLTDSICEDGGYSLVFVPTFKEATRIEKVDYDSPYPRYKAKSLDIQKCGLKNQKKNTMFQQDISAGNITGIISLMVNFHPDTVNEIPETLRLIREINKEALELIDKDGVFKLLIVPTTKEGSRVEKVDWDYPFPRLIPSKEKNSKKSKDEEFAEVKKVMLDDDDDDLDEDDIDNDDVDDDDDGDE